MFIGGVMMFNLSKKYKVYSFDIFDTILFRTVRNISEIYIHTYRDYKELFPEYIDGAEWVNIRREIEKKARGANKISKGSTEIFLKEAFALLPDFWKKQEELLNAEFETEKKLCFLNPEIYELVKKLRKEEARIVLTSDMYYTTEQLSELLTTVGFDLNLIDHIYVSCELGVSKKYIELYPYVLKKEGISPCEMVHIGDNEYSDVSIPKKLGIDTVFYDVISQAEMRFDFLKIERLLYAETATELFSIRNLLGAQAWSKYEGAERFWYLYGLMIMGPLCTGATEWVLDQADANDIKRIYPLMREGQFLCRLLGEATKHRENDYYVAPLYISRKSAFLPSLEKPGRNDISYVCTSNGIKIKDVFAIFDIEDCMGDYKKYEEVEIASAHKVVFGESNLKTEIYKYLNSESVLKRISENAYNAKQNIVAYFKQMGLDQPYITWDMGWRGYTQMAMNKILKNSDMFAGSLNLLIAGRSGAITNVLNGCDIRGFVSNYGKNWDETIELYSRIYELFYICDEGTTIGYEEKDGKVIPVTREISYKDTNEIKYMQRLQEGVLEFQKNFYIFAEKKPHLYDVIKNGKVLCQIVSRSLGAPTHKEAYYMGNLFYDQNFGADNQCKIVEKDTLDTMKKLGINEFFKSDRVRNQEWFSGMYALCEPFYYVKKGYQKKYDYTMFKRVCYVEKIIEQFAGQSIVLVGGGVAAREILELIHSAEQNIHIEAIVDNSIDKQGTYMHGSPIMPMETEFASKTYVITTFLYVEELEEQIKKAKGNNVKIIHYRLE